ncbi:hypothetical protein F5B20DRAFT_580526 [Whalleya microplaca]|nr:hypothetical protein F5B20DRAFT_580526 [Whalleya microplaca]
MAEQGSPRKGVSPLSPSYFEHVSKRLLKIQRRLKSLQGEHEMFNADVLIQDVCAPAFNTLRVIAEGSDGVAEDPELVSIVQEVFKDMSTLMKQPVDDTMDFGPGHLSNPQWNRVFQSLKIILATAVEALVAWDNTSEQRRVADSSAPGTWFIIITRLLPKLAAYPVLENYVSKLLQRLRRSSTGIRNPQLLELYPDPVSSNTPLTQQECVKRKADTLDDVVHVINSSGLFTPVKQNKVSVAA